MNLKDIPWLALLTKTQYEISSKNNWLDFKYKNEKYTLIENMWTENHCVNFIECTDMCSVYRYLYRDKKISRCTEISAYRCRPCWLLPHIKLYSSLTQRWCLHASEVVYSYYRSLWWWNNKFWSHKTPENQSEPARHIA